MTGPLFRRVLEDGRIVELWPMLYNFRITITEPQNDGFTFDDGWCYTGDRLVAAKQAFDDWDGKGEPQGWNKHPTSGRWRGDGTAASEENQRGGAPTGGPG